MNYELFLELQDEPDTNPGNNGGIDPSGTGGGNFPNPPTAHEYGLFTNRPQQNRRLLRVSSLADLRIKIERDAPQRGRIAIYGGRTHNPIPLFLAPLQVEPIPGDPTTLKIPDVIVQTVQALNLFAAEHTLGIELSTQGKTMLFTLHSALQ
jgi:hypothetical protein